MSKIRVVGECREIRTGTQASFQLRRLPIRPQVRPGLADTGPVAEPTGQDTATSVPSDLSGLEFYVSDRFTNNHRKTSSPRPSPHETNPMAFEESLESTGIFREDHFNPQFLAPTSTMVASRGEHTHRATITPSKTCSANLYRHIKRRVGRSLKRTHCKRNLVNHRKTSSPRPSPHETNPMAFEESLESTGIFRGDHFNPQFLAPTSTMVASRGEHTHRATITPSKTCSANLYRHIKRRVGRSLKRTHCKRNLVNSGKQAAYKLSGAQSSLSSFKRVPASMLRRDSPDSNRQHYGSVLHKGGRAEVGHALCSSLENLDLVHQKSSYPKSPTHPWPSECVSRQAIQAGSDHSNRVVSPLLSFPSHMQQVAHTSDRPLCYKVQQQTVPVCLTSTGSHGHCSGCTQHVVGGPGYLCLPTSSHIGQSGGETAGHPLSQNNSDLSGVAKHALVLGPSRYVQSDPPESANSPQSVDTTLQSDHSQESGKPKSPCMAPRATAIKEQGFSEAVAARIEAPQRGSTRSVYEAKWAIFTKWCVTNKVDFRAPPVKSVADFLMYLFQDRKLQPSTIDGYRSAIADKLGNSSLNISKDENLTRLLDSFHRDRPKGRRGIPSWNLSLVLHQLTKAPFKPLKEASLKHLTFKTVFLLALGSGKRRSEIHAWQNRKIRHQSDWSKVSLYPSPSFLSKNQLAKEGPDSVTPVVIPALAPTLDRSLKSDRSLCPVRALRYYLDRTSDLRQNKELVFVSFKKGFDKDISPATISSWIKQTVILCYELSD